MRFPDAEAMLIGFLEPVVDVPIVTEVPNPRPPRFVRLWRNAGTARNRVVDTPMITFEAWSADSTEASDLCEAVRGAILRDYTRMPLVRRVQEISGPGRIPDPESGTPRYRCTVELRVRASRA